MGFIERLKAEKAEAERKAAEANHQARKINFQAKQVLEESNRQAELKKRAPAEHLRKSGITDMVFQLSSIIRGAKVLGFDQFNIPKPYTSTIAVRWEIQELRSRSVAGSFTQVSGVETDCVSKEIEISSTPEGIITVKGESSSTLFPEQWKNREFLEKALENAYNHPGITKWLSFTSREEAQY